MRCDGDEEVGWPRDVCLDKCHWKAESKATGLMRRVADHSKHMGGKASAGKTEEDRGKMR